MLGSQLSFATVERTVAPTVTIAIAAVPNSRNTIYATPQDCRKVGGLFQIKWTCDPSQQSQIFRF